VRSSAFARQAVEQGHAAEAEMIEMEAAWRHWIVQDDGWFAVLHGEILCRV